MPALGAKQPARPGAYSASFLCAYVANTTVMVAVSILFRYADFVTQLGGSEWELGWIVGVGMVGAIASRFVLGIAIDRYGAGRIWVASLVVGSASLLLHLVIRRLDTPVVYIARILYTTSLAGAFGSSLTFITLLGPKSRMAEMIGVLGSSGFVGMAVGPAVADCLFVGVPAELAIHRMFFVSAGMMALAAILVLAAVHGRSLRPGLRRPIPIWPLLMRFHPGRMLLVGTIMGLGVGLPHTFLRPFAAELGVATIRSFFFVYAVVAFVVRLVTRQVPDRWGIRPTTLLGLGLLAVSMVSYLTVEGEKTLIVPAALGGAAHAFLFPAAMAGGSRAFPSRYRGLATTVMLLMFDLGNLLGQPMVGTLVSVSRWYGWPPYATMFSTMAATVLMGAAIYAREGRARRRRPRARARRGPETGEAAIANR